MKEQESESPMVLALEAFDLLSEVLGMGGVCIGMAMVLVCGALQIVPSLDSMASAGIWTGLYTTTASIILFCLGKAIVSEIIDRHMWTFRVQ